ncbi:MAG: homocysteine S-methyltransferase family protein, partial [Candidatus Omnitrophica bacterium]|nr:homocysteine S-methyltransferase family protein [Candidatus Omnitrophota bacterium]
MNSLRDTLKKEILLIDGGFGTYIQSLGLNDSDFGDKLGCMEYLNHSYPALVEKVHAGYLEAGAMAVETNSFGGNILKLSEYGLADYVFGLNREAAKIARKAADRFSTKKEKRFAIGSMGPTGKLPSSTDPVLGDVTYYKLKEMFARQAEGLIAGGVDALLVETGQDLLEMKAAVSGARDAVRSAGKDIVIMAQFTLGEGARMLLGTEVSAAMASLGYLGVDVIGINCGTGPKEMELPVKFLSENCGAYISCIPNAGLPRDVDGKAVYPLKPAEMAAIMANFVRKYGLDMVGGCCGTTPEHIKAIAEKLKDIKKRKRAVGGAFVASSYRAFPVEVMTPPIKIGERINTQGSKRMKELLLSGDLDGIVELGKDQEEAGAELLDVCVVLTERNTEKEDIITLTKKLAESVKIPLAIDSTDPDVIQAALSNYPGTAFINSANLEDGGLKAGKIFGLAAEFGAFVICLVIDKKGMARTAGEKISVAKEIYKIAVKEYGLKPHQLVFDMLTFSLGSGEKEYAGSAKETFEAIKRVKKELKGALTVLGVSNVSFGLPKDGRSVLNAVYLAHAVKAGLDFAIVNPSQYIEYKKIPVKQRTLSENLIFDRNAGSLEKFTAYFMKGKTTKSEPALKSKKTPIEKRLAECVIQRNKRDIEALVGEALEKFTAQEIIGDILLKTMREIGDKLASGELVLPYVLQSAEVMRKALEVLGKHLPKDDIYKKGRIVLATVFGDVHDIGKNLVKMILSNNGFDVIDLGKQVPAEKIIEEAKRLQADAVGLSALLVSTARHMRSFVQALSDAGLNFPVLIGGAATNSLFAKDISILRDKSVYRGGVFYAKDAFQGLNFAEVLVDKVEKGRLKDEYLREVKEYMTRGKGPAFAKATAGRQGARGKERGGGVQVLNQNHEPRLPFVASAKKGTTPALRSLGEEGSHEPHVLK